MPSLRSSRPPLPSLLALLVLPPLLALLVAVRPATAATVVDDTGAEVSLPQPPRRIVSLAPHLTEQLFAIGAGERIVGATDFADHPPAALAIPRVARAHNVDLERVAAARPDLIVVWGSGYPPSVIDALRRLGVPMFVSEPGSLEAIASSMERLARLTGSPDTRAADEFRAQIAVLRARHAGRKPVTVFYQVWAQPLMTLSGSHVISEALRVCGARNVFEQLAPIAPQVSVEAVIAANPDLIVTAEADGGPSASLEMWKRYPALRAVAAGRLVTLDASRINRHGPRLPAELARLCDAVERARSP